MTKATIPVLLALSVTTSSCVHHTFLPPLNLARTAPPVSARFVTVRSHKEAEGPDSIRQEWLFWREANRIEINVPERQRGEAWLREGSSYYYQKLFHADRKIVEYAKEDLQALNISVNWRTNELMIDPEVLQRLSIKERMAVDGHPALRMQDRLDGIEYEVVWLVDLDLPQHLTKQDAKGNREETELLGVKASKNERTSPPDTRGYEIIDFADVGDRERDPFVMKVQQELPGEESHMHSHTH